MKQFLKTLRSINQNPKLIVDYLQGTFRMILFKNLPFLIRKHIREQYVYRKKNARQCSKNGSCLVCGCKTDDLFFANKECSLNKITDDFTRIILVGKKVPCYPRMMNKKEWLNYKQTIKK